MLSFGLWLFTNLQKTIQWKVWLLTTDIARLFAEFVHVSWVLSAFASACPSTALSVRVFARPFKNILNILIMNSLWKDKMMHSLINALQLSSGNLTFLWSWTSPEGYLGALGSRLHWVALCALITLQNVQKQRKSPHPPASSNPHAEISVGYGSVKYSPRCQGL